MRGHFSVQTGTVQNNMSLKAHKGFTTADLDVSYRVYNTQNQYEETTLPRLQNRQVMAMYSLDFGTGLNHSLSTNLSYSDNAGSEAIDAVSKQLSGGAGVQLIHSNTLQSNYSAQFSSTALGAEHTLQQGVDAALAHRLYSNLTSTANVYANRTTVNLGSSSSSGLSFGQGYRHRIFGNGNLGLNWSGSRGVSKTAFSEGTLWVRDRQAVVPAFGTELELGDKRVIAESISIRNDFLQFLKQGEDFIVTSLGERTLITFVDHFPLENLVNPGSPIKLSYARQVDPNSNITNRSASFGISIGFPWIRGNYQIQKTQQTAIQGEGFLLTNERRQTLQVSANTRGTLYEIATDGSVDLDMAVSDEPDNHTVTRNLNFRGSGKWRTIDSQALLTLSQYRDNTESYDRRTLAASMQWRVSYDLNASVSANANQSNNLAKSSRQSNRTLTVALNWLGEEGLSVSGTAAIGVSVSGESDSTTTMQVGVHASQILGKLSLSGGANFDRSSSGNAQLKSLRFDVRAIRRF